MVQFKAWALPILSILGSVSAEGLSYVTRLEPDNFKAEVFGGKPSLVEFFAPWCGHCKKLAPVYENLAYTFRNSKNFLNVATLNGDDYKDLSTKYGISGFPTLKWFDGKSETPEDYTGGRDLESLQAFITEKTGLKPKNDAKEPSEVVILRDDDFFGTVGKDKDVFVAFTASWCGHCKAMSPDWEVLAKDFAPEQDVVVAKVDGDNSKELRKTWDTNSYPTIKFFPKGSTTPQDYTGGRDEKSFLDYLNEKAGTHRTIGGRLNEKAGTFATLDSLVESVSGSDIAEVKQQVEAAIKDIKDASAGYYLKVLDKLGANKGYVENEISRLEGMMKKSLARTKEDDFTRRLNVLKKFVQGKKDAVEAKAEL